MGKRRFIVLILFILAISFSLSAEIENVLHLNIQVVNSSNDIQTGTFSFVFNISTSSDCSNVVYTNSTSLTTDSRGTISYYLTNVNLNFSEQYWLCYYRNGVLINASKIAQVPYAFRAKNVTLSGVDVDTNLMLGIYNITAGIGNFGAGLSLSGYRLNVIGNVNVTGNLTLGIGTIAYNQSAGSYIYYNGTAWYPFGTGSLGGGSGNFSGSLYMYNNTDWLGYYAGLNTSLYGAMSWRNTSNMLELYTKSYLYPVLINNLLFVNSTNVGIGTTSPDKPLTIQGTGANHELLSYKDNTGTTKWHWNLRASEGLNLVETGVSDGRLFIKYGGNVGIGTTSPTQKLDVNGSVNITGNLYVNGTQITGGSGVPAGAIMAFNSASCPTGWILADGSSGTPDLRGIFLRGSGTNSILKYANESFGYFSATYGTYGNDSMQGHKHTQRYNVVDNRAAGSYNWYSVTGPDTNGGDTTGPVTDGVNGVPRTGAETRPAYYATIYCVKTAEDTPVSNTIWGTSGDYIVPNNSSLILNAKILGSWSNNLSAGVNYQVTSDGFVIVMGGDASDWYWRVYIGNSTTKVARVLGKCYSAYGSCTSTTTPIHKGEYFNVTVYWGTMPPDAQIWYMPFGSGTVS